MITPYSIASQFIGRREVPGIFDDPLIMEWLKLDHQWPTHDEVPWCSAFVNWICKICGVTRTKSLLARSWLGLSNKIMTMNAQQGFDIVILKRSGSNQPGPNNMSAPGHVGFYAFNHGKKIWILGGNQNNGVNIKEYPNSRIIGLRRLVEV